MKKKITLLDCTLRDGGYYNNWDFPKNLISDYLNSMASAGIEFVEIGFRSLEKKTFKGACAYSMDSFINNLQIPNKLKIGIMINASELINFSSKKPNENIRLLFKNKKSKVKLVRIACHYSELDKTLPISKWLKKRGFKVGFNIMQIADRSDNEVKNIGKICSKYPLDVLYFADSMGSLKSDRLKNIISLLKKFWKGDLGIHTHDNMDMALANTQVAVENGVTWVDSTVTGMGRGPGNSKTEYLVLKYQNEINRKVNILPLLKLIDDEFEPLQQKYKWGSNPFYFLAGMYGIHPTFVQGMLNDLRFNSLDILSALEHLKSVGGKTFNKNLLDTDKKMYSGKCEGKWLPKNKIFNKEVLILGTGPGINEHKLAIEEYIKNKKPFVIGLNTQKSINEKMINIRAACHALRLITDRKKYKSLKQPLVIPLKRLPKEINNYLSSANLLDFGIQVVPGKFDFKKNYGILPNSLVISYALAIATSGKAKKILLAGFDGYSAGDPRRIEMENMLSIYQKSKYKIPLVSITPTRYKIDSISVYALND